MMVNNIVLLTVKLRGKRFFRNGHTDRVGDALSERPGCGFNPRCIAVLRVTRCF
ncbi:hypothetical protein VSP9026_00392 [Vibrio spartinae]|uniref:Uncharacterized protein n=1 Tax=Vibrio spartinae TaxID=1918945 RepID=A0A1N6M036_9VIBR|nr:hypothetical protein VSP9026_00392 [Vibrio spartinae]